MFQTNLLTFKKFLILLCSILLFWLVSEALVTHLHCESNLCISFTRDHYFPQITDTEVEAEPLCEGNDCT